MSNTFKDMSHSAARRKACAHGYADPERFAHSREAGPMKRLKRRLLIHQCPAGRDCEWCAENRRHAAKAAAEAAQAELADYGRGLA